MTKQFKRIIISIITLMLMSAGITSVFAQSSTDGMVRFVHAIPGASAIDVYTDGQLTISDLGFGDASNYVHVPAGDHQLTITQTGATTPLWQQSISAPAGSAQTLVAASASQ